MMRGIAMRVKDKVARILDQKPEARDNDKLLMLQVWEIEGFYLSDKQREAFMRISSPESIRRMRQKFQEEGQYLASPEVDEKRYQMYVETKDAIQSAPSAISWLAD
jgi:hypothetical protein